VKIIPLDLMTIKVPHFLESLNEPENMRKKVEAANNGSRRGVVVDVEGRRKERDRTRAANE